MVDFACSKDPAASPASFDVLDAFEQLGGFGALIINAHFQRVSGDIPTTTALGMAEHDEETPLPYRGVSPVYSVLAHRDS
jgi:hypothetical protein